MRTMRCFVGPHHFCLHFALHIMTQQNATFWGVAHPATPVGRGLCLPNLNSAKIFVQCTYLQVSSSYVYLFGSYRVDKQTKNTLTNKRRRKHATFFATIRRWVTSCRHTVTTYTMMSAETLCAQPWHCAHFLTTPQNTSVQTVIT